MKNYRRGRLARIILSILFIFAVVVYLNRISIAQKIISLTSQSQLVNLDNKENKDAFRT